MIWCGATAIAVFISWFAVRDVLRVEFVDDVRLDAMRAQTFPERDPTAPPTRTALPTPVRTASPAPMRTARPSPAPRRTTEKPPSRAPEDVRVVRVKRGEVAFGLGASGCRLVSATPAAGHTAKVTEHPDWVRVDLVADDGHGTAVFCVSRERRTDTWDY